MKQECKYCYREVNNSGIEGFRCTNKTVNTERSWCRPKNANMPYTICKYFKPREEIPYCDDCKHNVMTDTTCGHCDDKHSLYEKELKGE